MASKSRSRPVRKKSGPNPLADLGMFDIPNIDMEVNSDDDSDVDESTLESELEALMKGEIPSKRSKPKPKVAMPLDLEKIAAECLKEDDEDDDDDQNLSGDEDLLKELQKISPEVSVEEEGKSKELSPHTSEEETINISKPTHNQGTSQSITALLSERLSLYNEAISAAKLINDTSKVRRYGRAVKTLESQLKSAKSGCQINDEDIPPVVSIPKISQPPARPIVNEPESVSDNSESKSVSDEKRPSVPPSVLDEETNVSSSLLITRRDQYKVAALQAKKSGNKDLAIKYIRIAKSFDAVIEAANNNQPVDLSNIPPPPPGCTDSENTHTVKSVNSQKRLLHEQVQTTSPIEMAALAAAKEDEASEIFDAPEAPTNVLEALQQRLEKYSMTKAAAEAEGNSGKVRRLQRIVKSYETAIKDYKVGKHVDFDELPTPPGFAPIPVKQGTETTRGAITKEKPPEPKATNPAKPVTADTLENNVPSARKPKIQRTNTSTADKQLDFLLERQRLFRQAALTAKQNGDLQQAKEYLRMSKGFDSMIEATKCGLPIDATTIPTPPQLESNDFEIIESYECVDESDLNQDDLFETLQKDLCNQLEICSRNKEHFFKLGDVSSASKFEKLAYETKKDLAVIQSLKKKGETVPKFHYETRLFSMVLCHTDLADNDLEVTVERGINLPGKPDDLDSYVKVEFPIPNEAPQRQKTHTIKDTNNPIFQETFRFEFNRKSRSHLRLFKRHSIKFEVYARGGFLRADTLLGTATIKMVDLESKCLVHDSYNLMDGRKACGGKLEVKIRIRDPLLVKQVEEVREKWLVIGS